jgi:hypothetical protein
MDEAVQVSPVLLTPSSYLDGVVAVPPMLEIVPSR